MFDRLAPRYDLLNRLLSLCVDVWWRRVLAHALPPEAARVLDIGTGTADVPVAIRRRAPARTLWVAGLDPAMGMLRLGQGKLARHGLANQTPLLQGDAMCLPIHSDSFDAVTIAFSIRNVPDVAKTLAEVRRVLKPGGHALILEFSMPENRVVRAAYQCYFRWLLPRIGGWLSGCSSAYRYLNQTVETFPSGAAFCRMLTEAGFDHVSDRPLTFGIATLYTARNPKG